MARKDSIPVKARRISPRRCLQRAKDSFWVVFLTVLIWVYADLQFTDTLSENVELRLRLDPKGNLALLSPTTTALSFQIVRDLSFEVRGSRGSLDRLQGKLRELNKAVPYDLSRSHQPGDTEVNTAEALDKVLDLRKKGIEVVSASPGRIAIQVDRVILVNVPVEFDSAGAALDDETPPKLTPAEVAVRVGRRNWEAILADNPKPVLRTVQVDLQTAPTGKPYVGKADLIRTVGGVEVYPERREVAFEVLIKERTARQAIPVTVRVVCPPAWMEDGTLKQYVLKRQDPFEWSRSARVSGSQTDLEKLKGMSVDAYIVLTDDDKKPLGSWLNRPVIVRFPEGLQVRLEEELSVSFRLEKVPGP